jgi:hypothetical protein
LEIDLDIYGDCGLSVFRMSANGTTRKFRDVRAMSVIEATSEVKYPVRVFRMLTHSGHGLLEIAALQTGLFAPFRRSQIRAVIPLWFSLGGEAMRRRDFIKAIAGSATAWSVGARAQQADRVWRVAVIGAVSPLPAMLSAFREVLQQRGWTEGKNLSTDVRWPKGSFAQDPGLISEVLHSNVDVIVAWATPSALAARRATSTIPIVFLAVSDPVGSGLAASLAHPGGNATGSSNVAPDLSAKLLGTFAQLVPGMSSVGVVVNPANPGAVAQMDGTQQAVHALGLRSQVVNAGTLEEYERLRASQERGRQRRVASHRSFQRSVRR